MDNHDVCMGGVTLRSLLENKDFLTMPMKEKISEKDDRDSCNAFCDAAAAFLGPNLWDKTLPDFKLEYVDFEDILGSSTSEDSQRKVVEINSQNCPENSSNLIQLSSPQNPAHLQGMLTQNQGASYVQHSPLQSEEQQVSQSLSPSSSPSCSPSYKSDDSMAVDYTPDCKFSSKELALATLPGQEGYDPTTAPLQEEILKPQPMIRKSQKHFVPDSLKDDKYWARRRKNNLAAKRSREARRVKENQIVLRASFLEKENNTLKDEVLRLKAENDVLKTQLKKLKH